MTTAPELLESLSELARLYGVEVSYEDGLGEPRQPSTPALIAVLRSLGAPIDSPDDAPAAVRECAEYRSEPYIDPVIVAWGGVVDLHGRERPSQPIECSLILEDGRVYDWHVDAAGREIDPEVCHMTCPTDTTHFGSRWRRGPRSAGHIRAPNRVPPVDNGRDWGVFAPLYAIHSSRSWGAGDFTDLRELLDWTASFGGATVATLPLLAAFTGSPSSISPYSPASRLFWNEMFVDVRAVPEISRSDEARKILASPEFHADLEARRSSALVDYEGVTALKRRALWPLSQAILKDETSRRGAFKSFVADNSRVNDYGRFRAACEAFQAGWREWPVRQQEGILEESDVDPAVAQYHTYVQWVAHEQLLSLSDQAEAGSRVSTSTCR